MDDVTNYVIEVIDNTFLVILRVYCYDIIMSKFHKNWSVNKNSIRDYKSILCLRDYIQRNAFVKFQFAVTSFLCFIQPYSLFTE